MAERWSKILRNVTNETLNKAIDICQDECEWAPSIAEFAVIIERASGAPDWKTALKLAIRKEFTHPAIEMARKKVGSYAMQHYSAKELEPLFKSAYEEALRELRNNPQAFNQQDFSSPHDFSNNENNLNSDFSKVVEDIAWSKFLKFRQQFGTMYSLAFDDPIIHVVVTECGGLLRIVDTDEQKFKEKYLFHFNAGVTHYPNVLRGFHSFQDNVPFHSPLREVQLCGDIEKARKVLENGYKHYKTPPSESTRQAFYENIDKCAKNGRQDLCDMLCKWLATMEENGVHNIF